MKFKLILILLLIAILGVGYVVFGGTGHKQRTQDEQQGLRIN